MVNMKQVETIRPDIVKELRFFVNEYLPSNTIKSLQVGLNDDFVDTNYVKEKIARLRKDADALEHDLNIVIEVAKTL